MSAKAPFPVLTGAPPALADAARLRNGRRWLVVVLLVWALATWFVVPHGIGYSWRECDTQAIARNFLVDGFDPLHPRVDWRGTTAGYVECEFPLYQLMIATSLAGIGDLDAEWPGRLLALLAVLAGAIALHRLLEWRTGPGGALAGTCTLLATGSAALMATRVMPDALSFGLAMASLPPFVRYLSTGSGVSLLLSATSLALAGLQKPPALQLGVVMFGWTLLLARHRLREGRLWLAFAAIVGTVAAWLVHGKGLYETTGLSFGVTVGDTKFPGLEQLLQPKVYGQLAWTTLQYGVGVPAVLAFGWLLLRRRLDRQDFVLFGTVAFGLIASLRYSFHQSMGPQYHVFAAVAGAWCVARAWPSPPVSKALLLAAGLLLVGITGLRLAAERRFRTDTLNTPWVGLAQSVRPTTTTEPPRLIVRGEKDAVDASWKRRSNYEDPRFFYQSRLRGWALSCDQFDLAKLVELYGLGARVLCDMAPGKNPPEVQQWLEQNGEVVGETAGVRVHRLRERP